MVAQRAEMEHFSVSSSLSELNNGRGRRKSPPSVLLQRIWTLVKVLLFLGILAFVILNRLSINHIMNDSRPVSSPTRGSASVSNSSVLAGVADAWVLKEQMQPYTNETRRTIDALAAQILQLQQRLESLSVDAGQKQEELLQRCRNESQTTTDALTVQMAQLDQRLENITILSSNQPEVSASADDGQMQKELLQQYRNESQTTTGALTVLMAQLDQRLKNISAGADQMQEELQQYRNESQTTVGAFTVQIAHLDQQLETMSAGTEHMQDEVLQLCTSQIHTATHTLTTQMNQMDRQLTLLKTRSTQDDTISSGCGHGTIVLNGTKGSIAVRDGAYQNSLNCIWKIVVPSDSILVLSWKHFHLEHHDQCNYDWVTVKETTGRQFYGDKICGTSSHLTTNPDWIVMTNQLVVTFHSDSSNTYGGFQLDFQALMIP